jgi:peptidoglycan/LPS O-acetylase OafA/YrhL
VLSGYLIGRQLWRERLDTGSVRFGQFILRRGFRIWPLYYVGLAYFTVVSTTSWADWTFVSNYAQTSFSRGWSLSTEEQFYIVVPLLLLISTRLFSLRHQAWPLLALLVAIPIGRVVTHSRLLALGYSGEALEFRLNYPIHLHCEPLLIGLLLALLSSVKPGWFAKGGEGRVAWRAVAVMLALSVAGLALDKLDKQIFSFLALGLIFGGATYLALVDRSMLTRPLHAKLFYPISRLSYGMYLNHFLVVPKSTEWVVRHGAGLPTVGVFFAGLILGTLISVAVATLTFLLIEHPFLQMRATLLATRAQRIVVAEEAA